VSAHRWHETTPQGTESLRAVCVVCDVIRSTRYALTGGYEVVHSRDGKAWSSASPECKAPTHVGAEQAVRL
jgi:hypothetical protein